ncbi:hypothetical protein BSY18_4112 (plasmid) [Blastomonas sp. RAC04]|nr:hypothetical protein BSY18_4112 [Blastomonas sp. RAC04]
MDFLVGQADLLNAHCFYIGSSALTRTTNLTPILRSVVFVGKPAFCHALDFQSIGLCSRSHESAGLHRSFWWLIREPALHLDPWCKVCPAKGSRVASAGPLGNLMTSRTGAKASLRSFISATIASMDQNVGTVILPARGNWLDAR